MSTAKKSASSSKGVSDPVSLVFPSRVDSWLVLLVGVALAICFVQAWNLRGAPGGAALAALAIGTFSAATVLAFTVPCRYTLEAEHLAIRCGLIRKRIPYAEIRRVTLSASPLSAPALSLRRVRIDHGRSFALVSPRERERFVDALTRRIAPAPAG